MSPDDYILHVLSSTGQKGIGLNQLVKHVYNQSATLFARPDYQEVYRSVQQFLLRNSKTSQSLIERMEKRGYYRLNPQAAEAKQLMFEFTDECESIEETSEKPQVDLSLDLFPDM